MIDKLLIDVITRRNNLEREVFSMPPADMLDFNRRLGAWLELTKTAEWCESVRRRQDADEEEP